MTSSENSSRPNVPDLDAEFEYLRGSGPNAEGVSPPEAVDRITGDHAGEYGLKLRFFEQGEGEFSWYLMVEGDVFACINPEDEVEETYQDREDVEWAVEEAKDVDLVPRERLPKWGDWSSFLRCCVCTGALREEDKVGTPQGSAHEVCADA